MYLVSNGEYGTSATTTVILAWGYDIVAMGCDATHYTYTFPANRVAELDKTRGPQCHWSITHQGLPSQDKCLNVVLFAMS